MDNSIRAIFLPVILISLAHCTSSPSSSQTTSQVAESSLGAVVEIMTDESAGSGVLVSDTGLVATNFHVVSNSSSIEVRLSNGDRYTPSGIVDFDLVKDIAILKIPGFDLPYTELGNSNSVGIGDDVVVIGAPQGLSQSVSRGIISATRNTGEGYSLIQTDSAISPGSSGGGMFDSSGRLVGIMVSYLEGGQNLNFAVPINYVRGMINQEVEYSMEEFIALQEDLPLSVGNASFASNDPIDMETFISRVESHFDLNFNYLPEEEAWYLDLEEDLLGIREIGDMVYTFITEYDPSYQLEALSNDTLIALLELNHSANFAKIAVNESLTVTNEAFYSSITPNQYELILDEMLSLHEDMKTEVYNRQAPSSSNSARPDPFSQELSINRPPLIDDSPSRYQNLPILDGTFEVSFDAQEWERGSTEGTQMDHYFNSIESEVSFGIIEEEAEYSYEYMLDVLVSNAESGGLDDVELVEYGLREVNDRELLWANIDVTTSGVRMRMYTHVYTGPEGTVQLSGFSAANIADRRANVIEEIVETFWRP